MEKKALEFLKDLVAAPSPSGFEEPAQKVWFDYVKHFADSIKKDVHGNVIAAINPKGNPKFMMCGHCDEIGFMVNYIDANGFISFRAIGGVDASLLPGQRVIIHNKKGKTFGVIGKKAIHLMDDEERKSAGSPKIHALWIDIGARKKDEVEKIVSIGDPVTFAVGFESLKNDFVVSRGFDDKMGAFIVAEALRQLSKSNIKAAVYGVSTVQEEIGLRGAKTSAYGIDPDVGIAVDVTHGSDFPGCDPKKIGEIKLGKGPAISRGANINPIVFNMLVETARMKKIPYQIEASPGATGTDANMIQVTKDGVATGLVSVPNRYMHTPIEVISLTDLENTSKLLANFAMKLNSKISFIP
ncbi:MAG: M42 family metallopeptidase [Planctomycetes bacterium]|nr:M42 family metallopeptidase [Planctomycetota bacterium]